MAGAKSKGGGSDEALEPWLIRNKEQMLKVSTHVPVGDPHACNSRFEHDALGRGTLLTLLDSRCARA